MPGSSRRSPRPYWVPKYCRHRDHARVKIPDLGWQWPPGRFDSPESRLAYQRLVDAWIARGRPMRPAASPVVESTGGGPVAPLSPAANARPMTIGRLCVLFMEHAIEFYRVQDPAPVAGSAPLGEFETLSIRIAAEDRCSITIAAAKVRRAMPAAFEDWNRRGSPPIPRKRRNASVVWRFRRCCEYLYAAHAGDPVTAFGPRALKAIREKMIADGHARLTINERVRAIRQIFKWGAAEELVPETVWRSLLTVPALQAGRTEARETPPVAPVPDSDIQAVMPHLNPVVRAMVEVQRLTGARPGEVVRMTMGQIDRAADVWVYNPKKHKNAHRGKSRSIVLGPRAQAAVRPFVDRSPDRALFSPLDARAMERERLARDGGGRRRGGSRTSEDAKAPGTMWTIQDRYTVGTYARAVRRACEAAGVPVWSPNRLRHTRATEVRRDHGLESAGAVLGHTRLETTQIYAERSLQAAMEIARAEG